MSPKFLLNTLFKPMCSEIEILKIWLHPNISIKKVTSQNLYEIKLTENKSI